jgi:hypothetical protein
MKNGRGVNPKEKIVRDPFRYAIRFAHFTFLMHNDKMQTKNPAKRGVGHHK